MAGVPISARERLNNAARGEALSAISSLFNNECFSDSTVRCGGRTWKVHKMILCTQSKYFARVVEGGIREGFGYVAGIGNVIDLHGDDPDIVNYILKFLYQFDFHPRDVPGWDLENRQGESLALARLYITADKYMIDTLKEAAKVAFRNWLDTVWDAQGPHTQDREILELMRLIYPNAAAYPNPVVYNLNAAVHPNAAMADPLCKLLSEHLIYHAHWFLFDSPNRDEFRSWWTAVSNGGARLW